MKTTIDLPDALVKQVKLRAVHEGRKLKDAVAELLKLGLKTGTFADSREARAIVGKDKKTGLPLIQCRRAADSRTEITPERAAEILNAQDADWFHATGR